jgi:large subunit ribosomal protein L30e
MKELADALKTESLVYGSERTLKLLKNGKLGKVFVASNCREDIKESLKHNAKIVNVDVVEVKMKNSELGVFCKKPFYVSVVSLEK